MIDILTLTSSNIRSFKAVNIALLCQPLGQAISVPYTPIFIIFHEIQETKFCKLFPLKQPSHRNWKLFVSVYDQREDQRAREGTYTCRAV